MLLYLVRHGHTECSDSGKIAGFSDVNLSDAGREAVMALAKSPPQTTPVAFYSSDLIRAVKTLELMVYRVESVKDSRLRELNFGDWEGLTWDEVHQRDPTGLKRWSENWYERAPPGGESFDELARRTRAWLTEIEASISEAPSDSSILVAAHGGSIRALICQLLDIPLDRAFKFSIDHAHVSAIKLSKDGHHHCRFLNASSLRG